MTFLEVNFSMDENRIVELLTRKMAGEASAEELGELSYLLKKHPDSVYYEALLEQVWEFGAQDTRNDLSSSFKQHKLKFKEDLKFRKSISGVSGLFNRPAIFALVFACIFFSAAAYILNRYDQRVPRAKIEITARKGVRKEIKLPDGTIVHLNSDSRLSYDPDMLKNEHREVKLSGEAYFRVAADESRAFITRTNRVEMRTFGSEFNIREHLGEDISEATVLKGSIELVLNTRPDQKFFLKPLEKFSLTNRTGKRSTSANNYVLTIEQISPVKFGYAEHIYETSWAENNLVFQDESFDALLPRLERWYNVKIDLEDPAIRALRFTGIFNNENIVETLEAMKIVNAFNYKLTANQLTIY